MNRYATTRATTLPYKFFFVAIMGTLTFYVLFASFFLLNNPRVRVPSLLANVKQWYYSVAFLAEETRAEGFSLRAFLANQTGGDEANAPLPGNAGDSAEARSIPILVYHGILDEPDGSNINLTEAEFKEQLFALKRAGYESITLDDLYAFSTQGKHLPKKPVLITFDDGRTDSYYNGDPILAAVNMNAVMFVITKYVHDSPLGGYYLSDEELLLMEKTNRWEIGSHSYDGHDQERIDESGVEGNFFSNDLWREDLGRVETREEFLTRITDDLATSQTYLENLLQKPIRTFAFPFGDLGQNQKDAREKVNDILSAATSVYDVLFYQQRPGQYFTQFSPYDHDQKKLLVRRINMQNTWSGDDLLELLEKGNSKPLPYTDTFTNDKGWIKVWGDVDISNNELHLTARENSSGASAVLDGTALWDDYRVRADVISPNRTGVFVFTRFMDDANHAGCNFGTDFVHAEETINGVKRVLTGVRRPQTIPEGPFTVEASVEGRTLICSLNGIEIVRSEFLDPAHTHGGTGVKIWDEELGKSALIIRQFSVDPIKSEG